MPSTDTLLHAGNVFDGRQLIGPATVRITGAAVAGVTPGPAPDSEGVLRLGADTLLLPGLVDTHVHLGFDASPDIVSAITSIDNDELLQRMRTAAHRALRAGITTVRDLGDRDFVSLILAAEVDKHPEQGPEILAAGPPITTHGGHCYFLGGETEGAAALLDAVRERHARGCAVVKVMHSGGTMTPGSLPHESQYTRADLRTVVEEAHRLGLPVAVHAHGTAAIEDALAVGADSIEHASFMTADAVDANPDLLGAVAASGTIVSLTMGLDPSNGKPTPPPAIVQRLDAIAAAWCGLYERGARIVVGTDAGIAPFKPHDVLPYGLDQLTGVGPTIVEALTAATSGAAQAVGVGDRKGRIEAGADADLLAVPAGTLTDLAGLRDVRAVYRSGAKIR